MSRSSDHETLRNIFAISRKDNTGSINELDDYKKIVSGPAYQDFTPRNIKGVTKKTVQKVLDDLAKKVFEYIHNNSESFDAWHEKTCYWFIDEYNKASGASIKAGKAQKIINMSFKYLFCLRDATNYADSFKECHMPLDSYTIDWFCEKALIWHKTNDSNIHITATEIKNKRWSNLEYGPSNREGTYSWIQKLTKEYLDGGDHEYKDENGKTLTLFVAEFYIWPEQQFNDICKAIIKNPIFDDAYPSYTDCNLNDKSIEITEKVEKIKNRFK